MWEIKKLLVTSIFSFSYYIFYPFNPFPKQALVFMCVQYKSFENTVGKEEIACNERFLCFPRCFLPYEEVFPMFIKYEIVVFRLFLFGHQHFLLFPQYSPQGLLTLYQRTNFRLFQTQRIGRRQFQIS